MNIFKTLNKRILKYSFLTAFIFSSVTVFGISLDSYLNVFKMNIFLFILLFMLLFVFLYLFFNFLPEIIENIGKINIQSVNNLFFKPNKKCFLNCFLLILICYIPVIIVFFPGIIANDVLYQANFFINHDYIEIHPILYNFIVYLIFAVGLKIKSTVLTTYFYTLIQTLIMVSIFSYCIYVMSKYDVNFLIKTLTVLFFALHPINHVFSVSVVKDTLFSGFCLLFVLSFIEIINSEKIKKINIFFALLSLILMFLFRHNGFFGYILAYPFICYFLKNKKLCVLFLFPVVFIVLFSGVKKNFNIKPPTYASYLAVPLQQMGYVRKTEEEYLSNEEMLSFRNIVSKDNELNYNPYCVDPIKFDNYNSGKSMLHSDFIQNSINENPKRFTSLYLNWLKKYPKDYINAFMLNGYMYWYPLAKRSKVNIYSGVYLYTNNNWKDIFGIPVKRYYFLPSINKCYYYIFHNNGYENNPLTLMLFSIGINTCLIIFGFILLFYEKQYKVLISLAIVPFLFASVLFGPVCTIRYVYQNFLILPLIFGICFSEFKKSDIIE